MLTVMPDDDRLIGAAEAAEMLGVERRTILRWVWSGKLPSAEKLPGRTGQFRFRFAVIARLANERKERV